MSDSFRILATGELHTSDLMLCFIPASDDAFYAGQAFHAALQLANTQGAVLYEIDANYDPNAEYHQEDDIIDLLGSSMTYKEYWGMFPDERLERPAPDWQARILLQVSSPVVRLRSPTLDCYLVAETGHDLGYGDIGMAFFLALMPLAPQLHSTQADIPSEDGMPMLQPGYIRPGLAAQDAAPHPPTIEWQLGDEAILQAASYPPKSQRDWAWAWPRTYGPVYFNLYVNKTADELNNWLARVSFYRYQLAQGVLVQGEKGGSFADGYQQSQPYAYQLCEQIPGWGRLYFSNGQIAFIRSYQSPSIVQQALDASLLAAILAGELGELGWDVLDGDYVCFQATGDGLDSLRYYLDPYCDEDRLRAGWSARLSRHQVDASMAENWDQVAEAVGRHFHIPGQQFAAASNLEAWLRSTPITELPREAQVAVRQLVYEAAQEAIRRLQLTNNRILWSWRLVQTTG